MSSLRASNKLNGVESLKDAVLKLCSSCYNLTDVRLITHSGNVQCTDPPIQQQQQQIGSIKTHLEVIWCDELLQCWPPNNTNHTCTCRTGTVFARWHTRTQLNHWQMRWISNLQICYCCNYRLITAKIITPFATIWSSPSAVLIAFSTWSSRCTGAKFRGFGRRSREEATLGELFQFLLQTTIKTYSLFLTECSKTHVTWTHCVFHLNYHEVFPNLFLFKHILFTLLQSMSSLKLWSFFLLFLFFLWWSSSQQSKQIAFLWSSAPRPMLLEPIAFFV